MLYEVLGSMVRCCVGCCSYRRLPTVEMGKEVFASGRSNQEKEVLFGVMGNGFLVELPIWHLGLEGT